MTSTICSFGFRLSSSFSSVTLGNRGEQIAVVTGFDPAARRALGEDKDGRQGYTRIVVHVGTYEDSGEDDRALVDAEPTKIN